MKCQVPECPQDAMWKVEKIVSRLSKGDDDYMMYVYVFACDEHSRLLAFGKEEYLLPLDDKL